MSVEFNHIIMNVGKSKLLKSLISGRTMFVFLNSIEASYALPNNTQYIDELSYKDLSNNDDLLEYLCEFDRVIIYSNEVKCKNLRYIEQIGRMLDLDKCVLMFSSEM